MDYIKLTECYEALHKTTKRLEKTTILANFLKGIPRKDIEETMLLLLGQVFFQASEEKIGVSTKILAKALAQATGASEKIIQQSFVKTGDLGLTACDMMHKKTQKTLFTQQLTVHKVLTNCQKLATFQGSGTVNKKIALLAELFTAAQPLEAQYIVRTVLGDLRLGTGQSTLRDALVAAYGHKDDTEKVQKAIDLSNDIVHVAALYKEQGVKGLEHIRLEVGKSLNVMLYQKAETIADGFTAVGTPCACEYKYDGFRLVIEKKGKDVYLFTRRAENVTPYFPDVVAVVQKHINAHECIVDAEVIGIDPHTKKWLPFQHISQRIKRKYHIHEIMKTVPVMIHVFDALQVAGKNLLDAPFNERRKAIEKIIEPVPHVLQCATQIITSSVKEAETFYRESLAKGNEGIMMKSLTSPYQPGSRVGYGVKIKPTLETLDLVIVGATHGTGKRAGLLSSFTIACYDEINDTLVVIGKVGTGFKEKADEEGVTLPEMTQLLTPLITQKKGHDVVVTPDVVLEVSYEEIQTSETYTSGYALRFPRVVRLRSDRKVGEISTLLEVKKIYQHQKARKT